MTGVQSVAVLAAAIALLLAAGIASPARRARAAVAILIATLALAWAVPFGGRFQRRMGDLDTYTRSRANFQEFTAFTTVRLEAHLSHVILGRVDRWLGASAQSPASAFRLLSQFDAILFIAALIGVVWWSACSPASIRYAALCLAVPSTLLIFGYREIGHLSLPLATLAIPLMLESIERRSHAMLAIGAALAGLGAALHGFGLLALVGGAIAVAAARGPWRERASMLLTAFAFGTSFYLIWLFIDVSALGLVVTPGHAEAAAFPLRPLLTSRLQEGRMNSAILSAIGLRDIVLSACITGVPLLAVAAAAWRQPLTRIALAFSLPSLMWLIAFWPIQGIGIELDLVAASFPAVFALAWVCSQQPRSTVIAAALLAAGHLAFWWVLLGDRFVNSRV